MSAAGNWFFEITLCFCNTVMFYGHVNKAEVLLLIRAESRRDCHSCEFLGDGRTNYFLQNNQFFCLA